MFYRKLVDFLVDEKSGLQVKSNGGYFGRFLVDFMACIKTFAYFCTKKYLNEIY